jgi:hypothetical protein
MSREVPFDESAICDECNAVGAYDFMGDILCEKCADLMSDELFEDDYEEGEFDERVL